MKTGFFLGRTAVVMTFISALLIAAHFLREGAFPLVALSLAFPFLLLFKKPWARYTVQLALLIATAVWLRTMYVIAHWRITMEQPWGRMALILGGVALFTLLSALLLFFVGPRRES